MTDRWERIWTAVIQFGLFAVAVACASMAVMWRGWWGLLLLPTFLIVMLLPMMTP